MKIDWARGLDTAEALLKDHKYVAIISDLNFPDRAECAGRPNLDVRNGDTLVKSIHDGTFGENRNATLVLQSGDMAKWIRAAFEPLGIGCFDKMGDDFEKMVIPYVRQKMSDEKRILVVEDAEYTGLGYQKDLQQAFPDMQIDWARGLDTAEAFLKEHTYVAVISDQKFPNKAEWADKPDRAHPNGNTLVQSIHDGTFGENRNATLVLQSSNVAEWMRVALEPLGVGCFNKGEDDFKTTVIPYVRQKLAERMTSIEIGAQGGPSR